MNEPIHAHLDGELPLEELSEGDRRRVLEHRRSLDRVLEPLRREPAPDVSAAVMEEIRGLDRVAGSDPAPGRERRMPGWLRWLWRPCTVSIRLRPAWALAAAALALLLAWPAGGPEEFPATAIRPGGTVVAESREDGRVLVRFHLDAPGARTVSLAGDFTGWEPTESLTQIAPGLWIASVPVEPGIHEYAFVVDGRRWVQDPLAESVEDGFGGANSRVAVLPPAGREGV